MKKTLTFAMGAILLVGVLAPVASAALETEKDAAIKAALAHFAATQATDGSWSESGSYKDAFTGAVVFAFLSQTAHWPATAQTAYTAAVANGIKFLVGDATLVNSLSTNSAGVNICPGGSGTCSGIYWYGSGEQTYSTGFVSSAIAVYGIAQGAGSVATTTGPLAGLTWLQIMQGIDNEFSAYQSTTAKTYGGGWHYTNGYNDADMSTAQWGVISIGYAESGGAITSAYIRNEMKNNWLIADQVTTAGSSFGAACYSLPGSGLCDQSDTGGWLTSMAFVGNGNNGAAQNGMTWLNNNWNLKVAPPSGDWSGLFGYAYPMWAVYKGLESNIGLTDNTHILNLQTDCGKSRSALPGNPPGSNACNWWEDQNEYLVTTQNANGSWTDASGSYWPDPLNSALYANILGAVALPTSITGPTTPTATVPALSKWGLVLLGILLVGFAAMRLRKSPAAA